MPRKPSLTPTGVKVHRAPGHLTVVTFELDGRTYSTGFQTPTGHLDRVSVLKRSAKGSTFWQALGSGETLRRVAHVAAAHLAADHERTDGAELWRATAERFAR